MPGRADNRATAARNAAADRMRRAAQHLRAGDEPGDQPGSRESTAALLEHLAGQDLDVHTFDRAAGLADRILATSPGQMLANGQSVSPGYGDNGTTGRERVERRSG